VQLLVFYHFNLNLKTIKSENSLHNQYKGIFILFCFLKKQKQMIFALNKRREQKSDLFFVLLIF